MAMDSASLRAILLKTDNTLPSIQRSSAGMLSHYDRIPSIAVDDWRQCLATCNTEQLLPLVYVANDVIQISKRNRGNKYLEAFSPVLGSSLRLACNRDRSIVEKIRRTVKIWGDRKVFSVRFVNDVLSGLEPLRTENGKESVTTAAPQQQRPAARSSKGLSPSTTGSSAAKIKRSSLSASISPKVESEDDGGLFGSANREHSLNIDFGDLDTSSKDDLSNAAINKRKRTMSIFSPTTSISPLGRSVAKKKASLVDVLDELEMLSSQFLSSQGVVASIPESYFAADSALLESMVGDELRDMYKKVVEAGHTATRHCVKIHGIAQRRHFLEEELLKFIPQLRMLMKQDEEDLKVCEQMEAQIQLLLPHHAAAKEAREKKREEERIKQEALEAEARKREEEEMKRRELEETLKATESGAGMVWNPVTKEYQAVNDETMESWRD